MKKAPTTETGTRRQNAATAGERMMTPKELTEAYVNALYEYADAKEAQQLNCDPYSNAELREARVRLDDLRTKAGAMNVDLTAAHNAFIEENEGPE